MQMVDIIEKKVDGHTLTKEEIEFFVSSFTKGEVPDYQAAAFMMAIVFQDMDQRESADLTMAMMHSGDVVDLSDIPGIKVDKHSTGGVGDTTTLVVAPLVAACGGKVAKMSGRGLAFTGGTLDKLESIPGLSIEQGIDRFKEIVNEIGVSVIGQTGNLDPADKKMYALRDVTGTVMSVPLIASSIMSKKLAAGADAIVLDIKIGSGAFIKTIQQARRLAQLMVMMGKQLNKQVVAVLTDMNQPLGLAVGNALEVREAVELLSGKIPEGDPLYEVCMLLGTQMLRLSRLCTTDEQARTMLKAAVNSGAGLNKLRAMVSAQGGDAAYMDLNRIDELCKVRQVLPVYTKKNGYITAMVAEKIGHAAQRLGAGRAVEGERIDHAVGLVMHKRVGQKVDSQEPLATFYINDDTKLQSALDVFYEAFTIEEAYVEPLPLIYDVIRDERSND